MEKYYVAMRDFSPIYYRWTWVGLLLLSPFFLFPQGYRSLVLLIIPVLWLFRKLTIGRFFPGTPYNSAVFVMLGAIGLSLLVTFDLPSSLPKISALLFGIALFFSIVDFARHYSLWHVVIVFIAIGVGMAIVSLFGTFWQEPFEFLNGLAPDYLPRGIPGAPNGVINANEVAGVLSWIVPLMLACTVGLRRRLWHINKIAYIGLILIMVGMAFLLIATSSRGGMLALAASTVLILSFFVSGRWRLVLAIGVVIVGLVIASTTSNLPGQDIVGDALGLTGRLEIWSRALLALQDNLILGVSVNGFRHVVHVLYPLFIIAEDIDLAHAHNHLLQVALDLGLAGLISYLAVWFVSVSLLWSTYRNLVQRRAKEHPYYALVAGLAGALFAGWTFGIFDAVSLGSRPSFMWWQLIGLTTAVHYTVVYSGKHLHTHRRSSRRTLSLPMEGEPITTHEGHSQNLNNTEAVLAHGIGPSYNLDN